MPVRSLTSSVLKWPDAKTVHEAARRLGERLAAAHPELERLGCFGSYARGDWGVGSDLDLLAIVSRTDRPFQERALDFELEGLPVPADLLVYTRREWEDLLAQGAPFVRRLAAETVWVWKRSGTPSGAQSSGLDGE